MEPIKDNSDLMGKLAEKINAITKSLEHVEKDGENKFSKYKYISSENMLSLNRKNFPEIGLSIIPSLESYEEREFTSNDKQVIRTIVKLKFIIVDTETGYYLVVNWAGADQDTGGKSFGQAVTEACKRFYFKLFNVSGENEGDADSKTTEVTPAQSSKKNNGNGAAFPMDDRCHFKAHKDKKWVDIPISYIDWLWKNTQDKRLKDHVSKYVDIIDEITQIHGGLSKDDTKLSINQLNKRYED